MTIKWPTIRATTKPRSGRTIVVLRSPQYNNIRRLEDIKLKDHTSCTHWMNILSTKAVEVDIPNPMTNSTSNTQETGEARVPRIRHNKPKVILRSKISTVMVGEEAVEIREFKI